MQRHKAGGCGEPGQLASSSVRGRLITIPSETCRLLWTVVPAVDDGSPGVGAARYTGSPIDQGGSHVRAHLDRDRAALAALSAALTAPAPKECVLCYVVRMLDAFGCDTTLRWARHWRAVRLPPATGLERRLQARGGFCDCEVFLNGWTLRDELQVPDEDGRPDRPAERPPCTGVGPRSSRPCGIWRPWRRPRW